jgi:perosamine synthetase
MNILSLIDRKIATCVPMNKLRFLVHLDELMSVCVKWNIPIIEDDAESLGSEYKRKPTGSFGQLGFISFNRNKIVTCSGGANVTKDLSLGVKGKYLMTKDKTPHPYEYVHDELVYNFRIPNLDVTLACDQLEQLNHLAANKRANALAYDAFFKMKKIKFRNENPDKKANYWLMCVELENKKDRELFLKETNESKVMTRPIWQLMFRLPMYVDCQSDTQINALFLEERIVNIPSSVR